MTAMRKIQLFALLYLQFSAKAQLSNFTCPDGRVCTFSFQDPVCVRPVLDGDKFCLCVDNCATIVEESVPCDIWECSKSTPTSTTTRPPKENGLPIIWKVLIGFVLSIVSTILGNLIMRKLNIRLRFSCDRMSGWFATARDTCRNWSASGWRRPQSGTFSKSFYIV